MFRKEKVTKKFVHAHLQPFLPLQGLWLWRQTNWYNLSHKQPFGNPSFLFWIIHTRTSFSFTINNERHYPPHPHPPHKNIIFVYNQQRMSLPPHPHPPHKNIIFVYNQQRMSLPPPHPPPLPNTFIIHTRTSSSFTINNERHHSPPPTPPSKHVHHPHKNIIFIYNQQRTSSLPPTHPPFQTRSSSTQEHHLRLQSTTNVNTPSTKHWRVTSPKCPCHQKQQPDSYYNSPCLLEWFQGVGWVHGIIFLESFPGIIFGGGWGPKNMAFKTGIIF